METLSEFKTEFKWILTLGLAMSSLVDILITWFLTCLLQSLLKEIEVSTSVDRVIGRVVLYTIETNGLTSAMTILSMICWLAMPDNLIFLGLHFFIGKLYANSLLTTLNSRKHLQHQTQHGSPVVLPSIFSRHSNTPRTRTSKLSSHNRIPPPTKLEITVSRTIEFAADEPSPSESLRPVSSVQS
ncbi:hypothetical protein V8E55_012171 [Tylopilus felleus]